MMSDAFGSYGGAIVALLAVFVTFGTVNAYVAGMARVYYAAARRRLPEDARRRRSPDGCAPSLTRLSDCLGASESPCLLHPCRGLCVRIPHGQRRSDPDLRDRLHRGNPASQGTRDAAGASLDLPRGFREPPAIHRLAPGGERCDCGCWTPHQLGALATKNRWEPTNVRQRTDPCALLTRSRSLVRKGM